MTDLFDTTTCPTCSGSGTVLAHSFIAHASRRSDPETSQQAGKRHQGDVRVLRPGTVKCAVLRTFLDRHRTAQEAAMIAVGNDAPVSSIEGARRRVSDLIQAGYLEIIDLGHNEGGSQAQVYRLTYAGLLALNRIDAA
jgi:hypothetical protein